MEFGEFDLDRSTARAWSGFQARLADHLAAMADDDMLVIEVDSTGLDGGEGAAPFIQFGAHDDGHLRSEVSSNAHLASRYALDPSGLEALGALGWAAPTTSRNDSGTDADPGIDAHPNADTDTDTDTDTSEGSPNFFLDVDRASADRLAVMTVKALRTVFGVAHPAFLAAHNRGGNGNVPDLGIPSPLVESAVQIEEPLALVPDDVEHLRELVDTALEPVFGHGPKHDSDGDIPVVAGSALLFIRVLDDAPAIEIFSTIVRGITDLEAAAAAVAELNNGIRLIKFVLVDDVIIAVAHVPALPFAPQQLRGVLDYMSRVADGVDEDLVARVGGRRAFGDDPSDESDGDDAGSDLPPELVTLLHLDAGSGSTVEPDLAASVCNYDRDVVLKLLKISSQEEIAWRQSYDEAAMKGDRDEAAACDSEALGWAKTVETLRGALRVIVERNRR